MTSKKSARYMRIRDQVRELFLENNDLHSRMATVNSLLYHKMDGFFGVGFYMLKEGKLLVSSYQGPLACLELPLNKGVCWDSINQAKTLVVPDVHHYPGHIACDSRSRSEIVIPLRDKNHIIQGVLDIDSNRLNNFDAEDAEHLEKIVEMLIG